jgi:hypothetical protein
VGPYPTTDAFIESEDVREYRDTVHGSDARQSMDAFELAKTISTEKSVAPPSAFVEHVDDGTVILADWGDVGN